MGGLAAALGLAKAGHKNITIYEHAQNLGFVGAGIQLAPNMARILDNFGCWQKIASEAVQCANTSIREGSTDKELGYVDLGYVKEKYATHTWSVTGRVLQAGCVMAASRKRASHSN
jgi:salicylate hydroxylase